MNAADFKSWRKALRYTQPEAGQELGVNRSTIQNWEAGVTPVPQAVDLACRQLTRKWKQQLEFGPVALVYSSEQLWRAAKPDAASVFVECEMFSNTAVALRRALRLSENSDFKSPFIIDQNGEIVLSTSELLRQVRAAKRRLKT